MRHLQRLMTSSRSLKGMKHILNQTTFCSCSRITTIALELNGFAIDLGLDKKLWRISSSMMIKKRLWRYVRTIWIYQTVRLLLLLIYGLWHSNILKDWKLQIMRLKSLKLLSILVITKLRQTRMENSRKVEKKFWVHWSSATYSKTLLT